MRPLPRLLLDTNILVHLSRRDPLGKWLEANYPITGENPVPLISIVTDGEMRALSLLFGWGLSKQRILNSVLQRVAMVPLEYPGLLDAYAHIDVAAQHQGRKMGQNDLWIAATAHVTGATLLTTDKDFDLLHGVFLQHVWIDPATR